MGVRGLWRLLLPIGRRISIETLSGRILAVDASIWLTQFLKANRDPDTGKVRPGAHLQGFLRRICRLLYHDVRPVFVFDGATPEIKLREIRARRRRRERSGMGAFGIPEEGDDGGDGVGSSEPNAAVKRMARKILVAELKRRKDLEAAAARKGDGGRGRKGGDAAASTETKGISGAFSAGFNLAEEDEDDDDDGGENDDLKDGGGVGVGGVDGAEKGGDRKCGNIPIASDKAAGKKLGGSKYQDNDEDDDALPDFGFEDDSRPSYRTEGCRRISKSDAEGRSEDDPIDVDALNLTLADDERERDKRQREKEGGLETNDWYDANPEAGAADAGGDGADDGDSSDGESSSVVIPEDENDLDLETTALLPSSTRSSVIEKARRQQRMRSRKEFMSVAGNPDKYSSTQLRNFLRSCSLNKKIHKIGTKVANRTSGRNGEGGGGNVDYYYDDDDDDNDGLGERIASDSTRRFIFKKDRAVAGFGKPKDDGPGTGQRFGAKRYRESPPREPAKQRRRLRRMNGGFGNGHDDAGGGGGLRGGGWSDGGEDDFLFGCTERGDGIGKRKKRAGLALDDESSDDHGDSDGGGGGGFLGSKIGKDGEEEGFLRDGGNGDEVQKHDYGKGGGFVPEGGGGGFVLDGGGFVPESGGSDDDGGFAPTPSRHIMAMHSNSSDDEGGEGGGGFIADGDDDNFAGDRCHRPKRRNIVADDDDDDDGEGEGEGEGGGFIAEDEHEHEHEHMGNESRLQSVVIDDDNSAESSEVLKPTNGNGTTRPKREECRRVIILGRSSDDENDDDEDAKNERAAQALQDEMLAKAIQEAEREDFRVLAPVSAAHDDEEGGVRSAEEVAACRVRREDDSGGSLGDDDNVDWEEGEERGGEVYEHGAVKGVEDYPNVFCGPDIDGGEIDDRAEEASRFDGRKKSAAGMVFLRDDHDVTKTNDADQGRISKGNASDEHESGESKCDSVDWEDGESEHHDNHSQVPPAGQLRDGSSRPPQNEAVGQLGHMDRSGDSGDGSLGEDAWEDGDEDDDKFQRSNDGDKLANAPLSPNAPMHKEPSSPVRLSSFSGGTRRASDALKDSNSATEPQNGHSPSRVASNSTTVSSSSDPADYYIEDVNTAALRRAMGAAAHLTDWAGRAVRRAIAAHIKEAGVGEDSTADATDGSNKKGTDRRARAGSQGTESVGSENDSNTAVIRTEETPSRRRVTGKSYSPDDTSVNQPASDGPAEPGPTQSIVRTDGYTATSSGGITLEDLQNQFDSMQQEENRRQRDMDGVTEEMKEDIIQLLQMFGIPYVESPAEAEAQCATLETLGLVDGVVTEDSDIFVFGGKNVYKNIFDDQKFVEVYLARDAQMELGLTRERMVALAMLLGGDYTDGIKGVGIVNGMEIIEAFFTSGEAYDNAEVGLKTFRKWLEGFDPSIEAGGAIKAKDAEGAALSSEELFHIKHRSARTRWTPPKDFPAPNVLKAYRSPVVDTSRTKFSWGSPDIERLRVFCYGKLGWDAEETDRAIVPVMKKMHEFQHGGPRQTRLDSYFMKYEDNIKFADVRSKRLRSVLGNVRDGRDIQGSHEDDGVNEEDDETKKHSTKKPRAGRKRASSRKDINSETKNKV